MTNEEIKTETQLMYDQQKVKDGELVVINLLKFVNIVVNLLNMLINNFYFLYIHKKIKSI